MSQHESTKLETLVRIADALEEIAAALQYRRVIEGMVHSPTTPPEMASDAYETAVDALKDMPDDIPPEPISASPVKREDVVAALNQCGRVHGVAAAKKILTEFASSGKLDDVPEGKWPELIGVLNHVATAS